MGCALAKAALKIGWEVVLISGPVAMEYPAGIELYPVVSTEEMYHRALHLFPSCDMIVGAAAPCDYKPKNISEKKLTKSDFSGFVELVETQDILAAIGEIKTPEQILVAFALETHDAKNRALKKLRRKNADFVVVNAADAIDSEEAALDIYDRNENPVASISGSKNQLAEQLFELLIKKRVLVS